MCPNLLNGDLTRLCGWRVFLSGRAKLDAAFVDTWDQHAAWPDTLFLLPCSYIIIAVIVRVGAGQGGNRGSGQSHKTHVRTESKKLIKKKNTPWAMLKDKLYQTSNSSNREKQMKALGKTFAACVIISLILWNDSESKTIWRRAAANCSCFFLHYRLICKIICLISPLIIYSHVKKKVFTRLFAVLWKTK